MSDWSSDVSSSDLGKPLKARTYIQYADTHKEASRDSTDREGFAGYTIPVGEYRIQVRPDGIKAADRFVEDVTVNAAETTEVGLVFPRSEEHTSELQSLMRISYAVFCLKKKTQKHQSRSKLQ